MSLTKMSSVQVYFKKSEWTDSKNQPTNQEQLYAEQQKVSLASGNVKGYSLFARQRSKFLTKLNILLSYNPAIKLLGIYSNIVTMFT